MARAPDRKDGLILPLRILGPLVGLWLFVTAFNLFKPYHIDDAAHLLIAQWISQNPLHPGSGLINWVGVEAPIHKTNQPHLYFYLLAVWGSLFGYSEIAMHALQALFSLACIFIFFRLAQRWTSAPLFLTACFALNPVFVVGQNLMTDVPLLALWLSFFWLLTRFDSAQRRRDLVMAALVCGAACLTKYTSLVLIPILGVALVLERRWNDLWIAFIPPTFLVAWSLFNLWDYGGIHILGRPSSDSTPFVSMVNLLILCGAFVPAGLLYRMSAWRHNLKVFFLSVSFLMVLLLSIFSILNIELANFFLLFYCLINGVFVIFGLVHNFKFSMIFSDHLSHRAFVIFALWLIVTAAFLVVLSPFIASRHFLLVLPAILMFAMSDVSQQKIRYVSWLIPVGLALLSFLLSVGDYRFAFAFRDAVTDIRQAYPDQKIFVDGHWGLQWYAMQDGLRIFDWAQSRPVKGDIIIVADADSSIDLKSTSGWQWDRSFMRTQNNGPEFCPMPPALFYGSAAINLPWRFMPCLPEIKAYRVMEDFKPVIYLHKIRQAGLR